MLLALVGSNEFEKDERIAEFCQKALAAGSKHKVFFASDYIYEETSITAEIAKALTPSFFDPAFSVLVRHCEYMLADEQRNLVNFLNGLCQAKEGFQGYLALDFFESDDKKIDKRSVLWKFLEKQRAVELFLPPKYNAIQRWIANHVQKHFKRKISSAAAEYIADAIGGDTKRIHNEIQKILIYDNSIQEITVQHCLLFIKQDRDIPPYELQEPFGFKNLAEFLPKFRRILAEEGDVSISIAGTLRDHCLNLLHIQSMRTKKISDTEIASKILPPNRVFAYKTNRLPEQSSRWQRDNLQKTILRLDELSYGKKMGYYSDLPSFELAICSLLF